MITPRTITVDGKPVTLYETQVTHPATGTILWASSSGVIACHDMDGHYVIGRVDPATGDTHRMGDPANYGWEVGDAFRAAHQQAIGLETTALVQRAKTVIARWKAEGNISVANASDGRCYPPCPSSGISTVIYYPIASSAALEALVRSMREGWKYD